ncbi:MAG: acylphosphatase [Nitrospinae bacterium]|nr:acylphosphatase [Nitrospinota bacterium]
MENVKANAFVSGLVQGVFFRATTSEEANRIGGLSGWVRNLPDGRVEVMCEGPKEKVERLVAWLWHGPPMARVDNVEVKWGDATGDYQGFSVAYRRGF